MLCVIFGHHQHYVDGCGCSCGFYYYLMIVEGGLGVRGGGGGGCVDGESRLVLVARIDRCIEASDRNHLFRGRWAASVTVDTKTMATSDGWNV